MCEEQYPKGLVEPQMVWDEDIQGGGTKAEYQKKVY